MGVGDDHGVITNGLRSCNEAIFRNASKKFVLSTKKNRKTEKFLRNSPYFTTIKHNVTLKLSMKYLMIASMKISGKSYKNNVIMINSSTLFT